MIKLEQKLIRVRLKVEMLNALLIIYKQSDSIIKGQFISKCPFGVIVWTKIPTNKFEKFFP